MVGSRGFAKGGEMATHTFGGEAKAIELPDCADFVAGVAIHSGVGSDQGKTILMFVDVVNGDLPAIRIVAELALGAVFAAMQIGVAILTLQWSVAENKVLVAISTLNFCVPAAQRKAGFRMIEV